MTRYSQQPPACFHCGGYDHIRRDCVTALCSKCGARGHESSRCLCPPTCNLCDGAGHLYKGCPWSATNQQTLARYLAVARRAREGWRRVRHGLDAWEWAWGEVGEEEEGRTRGARDGGGAEEGFGQREREWEVESESEAGSGGGGGGGSGNAGRGEEGSDDDLEGEPPGATFAGWGWLFSTQRRESEGDDEGRPGPGDEGAAERPSLETGGQREEGGASVGGEPEGGRRREQGEAEGRAEEGRLREMPQTPGSGGVGRSAGAEREFQPRSASDQRLRWMVEDLEQARRQVEERRTRVRERYQAQHRVELQRTAREVRALDVGLREVRREMERRRASQEQQGQGQQHQQRRPQEQQQQQHAREGSRLRQTSGPPAHVPAFTWKRGTMGWRGETGVWGVAPGMSRAGGPGGTKGREPGSHAAERQSRQLEMETGTAMEAIEAGEASASREGGGEGEGKAPERQ